MGLPTALASLQRPCSLHASWHSAAPPAPLLSVRSSNRRHKAERPLQTQATAGSGALLEQEALVEDPPVGTVAGPAAGDIRTWQWRGHSITYTVAGTPRPGQGAVLCVHGFGASGAHWRKTMPALAQDRQVFALDLLGFGRSDKPLLAYSIDLWRDLVLDFATAFTGQDAILIGNSIGSLVCLAASAADTEGRIGGCCLCNCAGGMNNKAAADDWRIKLAMPLLVMFDWLMAQQRIARYFFDQFREPKNLRKVLERVYGQADLVDDELVQMIHTPSNDENALAAFVSIMTGPPGQRPELHMPDVAGPLLILWGDKDPCTPPDGPLGKWFQRLPKSRPNTEFVMLPGVGHCPQDGAPLLVNEHLRRWLQLHHSAR